MEVLEKKWALNLQASAKRGDISSILTDVLHKLRPTVSATARHDLALDIMAKISLLLCNENIQLNQSVLDASCQIVSQCCRSTDRFEDETQMYSFLCSLFHAIKIFLQKKMIKEALELRVHIIRLKSNDLKLLERIARTIKQIGGLYIREILDPLRETYAQTCNDETYFSLMNVLDDVVDLLLTGGIQSLQATINCSLCNSRLKSNHVTKASNSRLEAHLVKIVNLGEMCGSSSCELIPNASVLCQEYLYAVSLVVYHALEERDDFIGSQAALSRLDQVSTFFKSNRNLSSCVEFYKHFNVAVNHFFVECEPGEIEKNFELSFDALSSITQQSDMDETTFKVLVKACDNASRLIRMTYLKIREKSCEWWNGRMSIGLLSSMNKVILEMDNVIDSNGHSGCQGTHNEVCHVTSSSKYDVSLMGVVSKMILISLQHKMKDVQLLLPQAIIAQKTCLTNLKSLKTLGCVQWKAQWVAVARVSYNFGYLCKKSDLERSNLKHHQNSVFSDLLEAFLHLEDLDSPTLTAFSLWQCISYLVDSFKSLRKLHQALVTLVVAMAAVPDKKKEIFQLWLTVKSDKLAKKVPDVSLWKIYKKEKAELHSKYRLDFAKHVVKDEIVVLELEALRSVSLAESPASVEDWMGVVEKLSLDETWRTRAVVALLKRTWTVDESPSNAVLLLSKARLENIPTNFTQSNRELGLALAELAFWTFLCRLKTDRNRMKVEMERGKDQRIPTLVEHLRKGTDDVVPAYCNLDINNETGLLDVLATVVTIADGLVDGATPADFKGSPDCWDYLRNLVEVAARIFDSFGYDHRALGCWGLLAKLAALVDDRLTALLALGHLLADVDHESAGNLLRKGDLLAESLSAPDPDKEKETREIIVSYHLCKSVGCLNNGRYVEGKLALQKARSLLDAWPKRDTILHVQAHLITSKFKMLPSGLLDASDLSDERPHLSILRALGTVKVLAKTRGIYTQESCIISARMPHALGNSSQIMKVFCSVTLWYAQLCVRQRFAREFTVSMPSLLVALQRQALALRTAQLLSVLASMDLVCETPNCQVKINAMENITLLGKSVSCLQMARKDRPDVAVTSPPPRPAQITRFRRDFSPGTPIFKPVPFTAPEFASHPDTCACVYCRSPEIQTVALDIVGLQARFYSLQGNSSQAVEFFKGATQLHDHLLKKQTVIFDGLAKTLLDCVSEASRLSIKSSWVGTLFWMKFHVDLSYVDIHVRHDVVAKAVEMNRALAAALKKLPLIHGFLHPEVLRQQVRCASFSKVAILRFPHLAEVARKSIGQAVAETPQGPTKVVCPKTAPRPFNIFTDRYSKVAPKVLDLKTPLPVAPLKKPASTPAFVLLECSEPDSDEFVEPSPEPIPSTRRKVWTGSGLTKKTPGEAVKVGGTKLTVTETVESISPIMPEARKKLLFNIEEELTQDTEPTQQDKKTKRATGAPEKPVKTATSRARSRPQPAGEITSLPDGRARRQRDELHDVENVKGAKVKTRIPKSAATTEGTRPGSKTALIGGGEDVTQVTNLLSKIKIEDNETKKPARSRLKSQECPVLDALAPSKKKVLQPSGDVGDKPTKVTNKVGRPRTVKQTEMVKHVKVEEPDNMTKSPVRKLRAAPIKPKSKLGGSSSSSGEGSKAKVKLENVFRSPLKAGLENVGQPAKTRQRGRVL